ncbi:MAG: hypothetical protein R6V23_12645 [Bacteroidales bacterium]
MMRKIIILIIAILFVFNGKTSAQENDNENLLLSFNPQYLFTNAIRLDFDIRTKNSNNWWVISPYYYTDGDNESFLNRGGYGNYNRKKYESMYGLGLGIARKIYILPKSGAGGLYAMAGVTYKYFSIRGDNFTYVETTGDDGLNYYDMQDVEYTININSYGGSVIIGNQFNPFPKFYIDLYLGFGLKYSTHSSPENVLIEYNRGSIDYGYSGTQFLGGVRLGIAIF